MQQGRRIWIPAACLVTARAFALAPPPPPRPEPALVQVAAGEQPIRLAHAGVDVFVEGSLVHAVVDLTLANPNRRLLEGELQFPLHAGQTVTGFALDMADGSMREAVPVPKARGREVFEAVVRRGVDPALLEQTAGENFRLRVYPLRPGASRHVRIAIAEWLTPDAQQPCGWACRWTSPARPPTRWTCTCVCTPPRRRACSSLTDLRAPSWPRRAPTAT